jgi:hypothetical protein
MFVVETQQANYLFACPGAAEAFAASQRRHWAEMCPGIGRVPIQPVPLAPCHRFSTANADRPLEPGSDSDERCRRVQRHVHRWWAERDRWWASI